MRMNKTITKKITEIKNYEDTSFCCNKLKQWLSRPGEKNWQYNLKWTEEKGFEIQVAYADSNLPCGVLHDTWIPLNYCPFCGEKLE